MATPFLLKYPGFCGFQEKFLLRSTVMIHLRPEEFNGSSSWGSGFSALAISGCITRQVVVFPTSISKPWTGALFILKRRDKMVIWRKRVWLSLLGLHFLLCTYLSTTSCWLILKPRPEPSKDLEFPTTAQVWHLDSTWSRECVGNCTLLTFFCDLIP